MSRGRVVSQPEQAVRPASCQAQTGQSVAPLVDSGYSVGSRHSTHSAYGEPSAVPAGGAGSIRPGGSQYVPSSDGSSVSRLNWRSSRAWPRSGGR